MLDDLEYAEKVLEKHADFYEDEVKVIKPTIRYKDLLDEFGDNIDEALNNLICLKNYKNSNKKNQVHSLNNFFHIILILRKYYY